jgi:UDP-N-acetyl-D-glucosamine/UDP-N-acetyl-D-galactosamine dehydrogenase
VADPWADTEEVQQECGFPLATLADEAPFDALVVAVAHREYRSLSVAQLRALLRGERPVLADVKALYARDELEAAGLDVFRL